MNRLSREVFELGLYWLAADFSQHPGQHSDTLQPSQVPGICQACKKGAAQWLIVPSTIG